MLLWDWRRGVLSASYGGLLVWFPGRCSWRCCRCMRFGVVAPWRALCAVVMAFDGLCGAAFEVGTGIAVAADAAARAAVVAVAPGHV